MLGAAVSERQGLTEAACAILVYQKNLDFWGCPLKLIFSVYIIRIMNVYMLGKREKRNFSSNVVTWFKCEL